MNVEGRQVASVGMRVLVADDNRDAADSTAELLRLALECEVEVAYGGAQARQAVERQRPDAVVLDLQMPGMGGIELARLIRQRYPERTPFLVAVTGWTDAAQRLPLLDELFNRVLAKPLDIDQLVGALAAPHTGDGAPAPARVPIDLADLYTRAIRRVMPTVLSRGLGMTFDCRGPAVLVHGDPVGMQSGLHRLLLGLLDIIDSGFVVFRAEAVHGQAAAGACTFTVDVGGCGNLQSDEMIDAVIDRLALHENRAPDGKRSAFRSGNGVCPTSGALVAFSIERGEGALLRAVLKFESAEALPDAPMRGTEQFRAWIVDEHSVPLTWLEPQLRRLGWATSRFQSCSEALAALERTRTMHGQPMPALVVVVEGPQATAEGLDALHHALPLHTQRIHAVAAGSPTLGAGSSQHGFELRMYPFRPAELPVAGAEGTPPTPAPASMYGDATVDEPLQRVLLVDDNDINRLIGRSLLEALGYAVDTAHDGLDAIDHCRQSPPHFVLMDLDMPVVGGIDATVRLRELQRTGQVAPFAILAATTNTGDEFKDVCMQAGMDGFLAKPLDVLELQAHLRQFTLANAGPRTVT